MIIDNDEDKEEDNNKDEEEEKDIDSKIHTNYLIGYLLSER